MIEIDGVRAAFERMKPYEYGDELSDSFFRMIDLVTRTSLNTLRQQELIETRLIFDVEASNVALALERYGEHNGESVSDGYRTALEQVDKLTPAVVEAELAGL
jgi:hypothetical protein